MTVHELRLTGCKTRPLAGYLKSLGIFRLISEQTNAEARAWFDGDVLRLRTTLDRAALRQFFLEQFRPTPLLSPWNGGSGFHPGTSPDAEQQLLGMEASKAERYQAYRNAITAARKIAGAQKDGDKAALIAALRNDGPLELMPWLDASVVVTDKGEFACPPLLGSGGNEGRFEYSANFIKNLHRLIDAETGKPKPGSAELLETALFGELSTLFDEDISMGQFMGSDNPWDFVLLLEGSLLLGVTAVRRLDSAEAILAAAPFTVYASPAGYATGNEADLAGRGEQWMPIWERPATLREVRALFREGRLRVGKRSARSALDAAQAIRRVGVARGVGAVERFAYTQRNGNMHIAVSAGRWEIERDPNVSLLDQLDRWLSSLRRAARDKSAPESLERVARNLEAAMLRACRYPKLASAWMAVLAAAGDAEQELVERPRTVTALELSPLPPLSPEWARTVLRDSGSEARLAVAVACLGDTKLGSIRRNCLPLDGTRFATGESGLLADPSVVWSGRDLIADLVAVVERRLVDGMRQGRPGLPLDGPVRPSDRDLENLISGADTLDERLISRAARALMAVEWKKWMPEPADEPRDAETSAPNFLYALFRLLYAPSSVRDDGEELGFLPARDPAPLRALLAGRVEDGVRAGLARLRAGGLRARITRLFASPETARRTIAALAFGADRSALGRYRTQLTVFLTDDKKKGMER